MKISVVMPAYNEEKNIESTVRESFRVLEDMGYDHEVVVVNDGSSDNTGFVLARLSKEFSNLKIGENRPNLGYGAAMAKAIELADGDLIVTIDSDGQFDISELPELLNSFSDDYDVLTGYRKVKKDKLTRVIADRVMNLIVRVLFWVRYKDTNCAYKILRKEKIEKIFLEAKGFQLPTEILLKAHFCGMKIKEVPVNHRPREAGKSALGFFSTSIKMFTFLLYLRFKVFLFRKGVLRGL